MTKLSLDQAAKRSLGDVVAQVRKTHEPLVVTGPDGDLAMVVPMPQPVRSFKGRPVYKIEDAQHLVFSYWADVEGERPWWN